MNDLAIALRKRLHEIPERSGAECQTRAMLIAFLKSHTTLEVKDMGTWLYAAHREGDGLRWRARGEPLERTCSFCSSLRRKRERVHANAWRCLKESALTRCMACTTCRALPRER